MRDCFPISSTDGKSYAIRQEFATLPFSQLSSTPKRMQIDGISLLGDQKRRD